MGILDLIIEEKQNKREAEYKKKEFSLIGSLCPHCKTGKMYPRQGKYGGFLGCSNYPNCAYIINEKYDNDIGTAGHKEEEIII